MAANLTIRAERALLGAVIANPHLATELAAESADFSLRIHARIFDALTQVDAGADPPSDDRRREIIAVLGQPQVSERHLDILARQCPEPDHGHVYARLVQEAAVRRLIAGHADRLGQQAASLGYDARRLIRTAGEHGHEPENLSLHIARVATALRSHATAFDPGTASVLSGPAHPADLTDLLHSREFWAMASQAWGNAATRLAGQYAREQAEEQVLTALLHDHPGSAQVLDMLSAAEFTDHGRQRIFTTIRELRGHDQPVDPLIVDWEIARDEAAGPSEFIPDDCWTPASAGNSYVSQLAWASVDPGRPLSVVTDVMLSNRYRPRDFMPRDLRTRTERLDPSPHPAPLMRPPPGGRTGPGDPQPRP
jgi:hypothetical protein